jgi:regulator of protease activity HflC (stomatin/prohibitin superfamily)
VRAVASLDAAVYTEAQMVARRWVAGATVDQLLERRHDARAAMRAELGERASRWGAAIVEMDLKDIVLPGEMKTILNQVIEAEKRAAANVILRREETAATRSLANTAKLLEQNPTLLRLKELEAWKEIAERVEQLTLIATPQDLAARLTLPGSAR